MYNRMYECDSKQVQLSMCVHCECLIVCTCVQMSVRVGTCVSVCVCLNARYQGRATAQV